MYFVYGSKVVEENLTTVFYFKANKICNDDILSTYAYSISLLNQTSMIGIHYIDKVIEHKHSYLQSLQ